ncbi:MAG: ferritin-like domain-containing protein [Deltaproteobacteria bacterium]|nr:ferritin-like domain-containing protein [Deltaproteobacteria bacterium]
MGFTSRTLVFTAVTLGALTAAAPCSAQDSVSYVTAGLLLSIPLGGSLDQVGLGVEGSYHWYPDNQTLVGTGGFVQAQLLFGGGWRVDLGAQGSAWFGGAELGLAVVAPRWQSPELGIHVAPFLSAGYATAAFRWTPMITGPLVERSGYELTLAPKLWWELRDGPLREPYAMGCNFGCSIGRPLMVDGRAEVADIAHDPAWADTDAATDDALTDAQRAALAAQWTRAMSEEHASVAAFARLSLQLLSLGAPPELVARTHRAALDEVDHARRSAALASRFAGRVTSPGALPAAIAPIAIVDLATLAVETLREGCLGEAVSAQVAARSLALATDPEVRETLGVIARDEAEHAALAWDLVDWCLAAGGDPVRCALTAAAGALPVGEPARHDAVDAALLARGWVPDGARVASWSHRRREALRRVGPARATA